MDSICKLTSKCINQTEIKFGESLVIYHLIFSLKDSSTEQTTELN